jgi:hypothetical protein
MSPCLKTVSSLPSQAARKAEDSEIMAIVTMHNVSANHGGACNCEDWHAQGPASTPKQGTLSSGQTSSINLTELGWDQYEGQQFELAAKSGFSGWRHSGKVIYDKDAHYSFSWYGPDGSPKIVGPQ